MPKDRLSIAVVLGDRCSREGKEGRLGEGITQCLCQPVFDFACLGVEATLEPVLAAVRLIADHHDVVAFGEGREFIFIRFGSELLNGGEDDAAARSVPQ